MELPVLPSGLTSPSDPALPARSSRQAWRTAKRGSQGDLWIQDVPGSLGVASAIAVAELQKRTHHWISMKFYEYLNIQEQREPRCREERGQREQTIWCNNTRCWSMAHAHLKNELCKRERTWHMPYASLRNNPHSCTAEHLYNYSAVHCVLICTVQFHAFLQ